MTVKLSQRQGKQDAQIALHIVDNMIKDQSNSRKKISRVHTQALGRSHRGSMMCIEAIKQTRKTNYTLR